MSMADCNELFEYWMEWPPEHVILGMRYLDRKGSRAQNPMTENDFQQGFGEIAGMMGQAPGKLPDHLRNMADWAEDQKRLMNSGKRV